MKHINKSDHWKIGINPLSLRCEVNLGSNAQINFSIDIIGEIQHDNDRVLPENKFSVRANGDGSKIDIVGKEDLSNRCLLTIGVDAPLRGTIDIFEEATTAFVLCKKAISTKRKGACEALVLLDIRQAIVFHAKVKYDENHFYQYTWDGKQIKEKVYFSLDEWEGGRILEEEMTIL